jgi:hypothetical protein
MRYLLFVVVILLLGAAVLALPISYMGLDPLPGDFTINQGTFHMTVPVTYSLCASFALGLFYYFLKR